MAVISTSFLAICLAYKPCIRAHSNIKQINIRYNWRHEQHMPKEINSVKAIMAR